MLFEAAGGAVEVDAMAAGTRRRVEEGGGLNGGRSGGRCRRDKGCAAPGGRMSRDRRMRETMKNDDTEISCSLEEGEEGRHTRGEVERLGCRAERGDVRNESFWGRPSEGE